MAFAACSNSKMTKDKLTFSLLLTLSSGTQRILVRRLSGECHANTLARLKNVVISYFHPSVGILSLYGRPVFEETLNGFTSVRREASAMAQSWWLTRWR